MGNLKVARALSTEALQKGLGLDVDLRAAFSFASAGDSRKAEAMAQRLANLHTEDTVLNAISIPLIRSAIELHRGNASLAIDLLNYPVSID